MSSLEAYLAEEIQGTDSRAERRLLKDSNEHGTQLMRGGSQVTSFAGNDYLGLRQHPAIIKAAQAALKAHGSGAGASRLITGNHPYYTALEQQLARHNSTQASLVFGSGYAASVGIIPALMGKGDLILADKLAHACMLDGAKISGATLVRFQHNDTAHLQALLNTHREQAKHCLIVTEHIFSMDGDKAPIAELSAIAKSSDSWLMVDDAHGLGVVPKPTDVPVDIWMGTLSKAAASYGGYVCGSRLLMDMLINHARSFIFSTGLPPCVVAGAHAALVEIEQGAHAKILWKNIALFAGALGIAVPQSAVVPVIIGDAEAALKASDALYEQGFLVPAIRPPTVPKNTSRLRISLSAAHTDEQILGLAQALKTQALA